MKCLILLISLASWLHAEQSRPSYAVGQSGYGSTGYAPVGYRGPLAKTVVLKDGHIADTPEVTAAKNLHYSAVHKAQAEAAARGYSRNDDDGSYKYGANYASDAGYAPVGYHGPLAKIVVLKDGHIADTPEVAAAKTLHYSAVHKAQAEAAARGYSRNDDDGSYKYGANYAYDAGYAPVGYHVPLAKIVVLKDGHIADTPEVAAAKTLHYSAVHKAEAEAAARGYSRNDDDGSYKYGENYASDAGYAPVGYHGPLAKIVVLKDGHIADTPEVAAAKTLHYSAVHKAQAEAAARGYSRNDDDGSYKYGANYASDAGYAPVGYHVPLAKIVVLKDGHIADTPEVAAAKTLHYSAVHKAQAEAAARGYSRNDDDGSYKYGANYASDAGYAPVGYHGPLAKIVVLKDGHIADTPEVAAAKTLHYSAVHKAEAEAAARGYSRNDDDGSYKYGANYASDAGYAPVGYHGPLAKIVVLKDGHIADTPEVAAAKTLHYSAVHKAEAEAAARGYSRNDDDGSYKYGANYASDAGYAPVGYHGPLAKIVVLKDGHIADTPEVAAAKTLHYSAVHKAEAEAAARGYSRNDDDGSYKYGANYASDAGYAPVGYHVPLAKIVVLKDGYIADIPEVAAAKTLHYSAVHKAEAEAAARGYSRNDDDGSYKYGANYASDAGYAPVGYHVPLAKIVVLKDGYIADIPEVAAAKTLHYSAVHKAQAEAAARGNSRDGYDGSYKYDADYASDAGYGSDYAGSSGFGSEAGYDGSYDSAAGFSSSSKAYSGPLAYPKVLPSGLIAETHEVAAAKQAHLNAVAVTAREHAEKWRNNYYH